MGFWFGYMWGQADAARAVQPVPVYDPFYQMIGTLAFALCVLVFMTWYWNEIRKKRG